MKNRNKVVWSPFKLFWLNRNEPTRQSERKNKKRNIEDEVGRSNERVGNNYLSEHIKGSEIQNKMEIGCSKSSTTLQG